MASIGFQQVQSILVQYVPSTAYNSQPSVFSIAGPLLIILPTMLTQGVQTVDKKECQRVNVGSKWHKVPTT